MRPIISSFLSDRVKFIAVRNSTHGVKQFAFQWINESTYQLPIKEFKSFLDQNFKCENKQITQWNQLPFKRHNEQNQKNATTNIMYGCFSSMGGLPVRLKQTTSI
eukprot:382352_1